MGFNPNDNVMLYTVKQDLELCIELSLTPSQLLFVKMLVPDLSLEESERRKASYALSMKYQNELKGLSPQELADLINREIIIDLNDLGKSFYEYYEINPKFNYLFSLKIYPMVNELFDEYPALFNNAAGVSFIAKNCSANEIALDYLKAINKDEKKHKEVIEHVKWAKANNAIVMGLKKFVATRYWEAIKELKHKSNNTKNSNDVTIL